MDNDSIISYVNIAHAHHVRQTYKINIIIFNEFTRRRVMSNDNNNNNRKPSHKMDTKYGIQT